MYSSFQLAKKYIRYYLTAPNGRKRGVESPFVLQFILNVLHNKSGFVAPAEMEQLRNALLHDQRLLEIEDFGAGSRVAKTKKRSVAELAHSALKPKKYAQLLFRLVSFYQPKTILELGTSLGVTTSYLAKAAPAATVTTIEGSSAIAAVAAENFAKLKAQNIRQFVGNFDELLPSVIRQLTSIDLAYIDGNHRMEPTVRYFQQLLPVLHNQSILVFDDIHWSAEMESAWEEIKQHPSVTCTVDVFFLGFVFFRKEFKVKQHFQVRF
jgi:predicted O-methyltransferase YrrM